MLTAAARQSLETTTREAAGKSGTSNELRDAWFVGFSGDMTAAVWMGNDDGRPNSTIAGGTLPADVWQDFMHSATERN